MCKLFELHTPSLKLTDILSGSAKTYLRVFFRALILVNLSEGDVRGYFVSDSYSHVHIWYRKNNILLECYM